MLWTISPLIVELSPMWLPRPGFTVRRLMVVVTIAGITFSMILGLVDLWQFLKNPYRDDPRYIKIMRERANRLKKAEEHFKMAAHSVGKRAMFHAAMEAKWNEAADTPLHPIEPDPPEPE
jgi:hypothetical protein